MFVCCVEDVKNTDTFCDFKEINYSVSLVTSASEPNFEFVKNLGMFYRRGAFPEGYGRYASFRMAIIIYIKQMIMIGYRCVN